MTIRILFLLTFFVTCNSWHMIERPEKSEKYSDNCLNNGFFVNNTCINCPTYTSGEYCEYWQCLNYGYNSDSDLPIGHSCECPLGFLGTHCEPTRCVDKSQTLIDPFNENFKSATFLITYNADLVNMAKTTTQDDSIKDALSGAINSVNLDRVSVYLINFAPPIEDVVASEAPITCNKITTSDLSNCILTAIADDIDSIYENNYCNISAICDLIKPQNIKDALDRTATNSPLIIVTDGPLVNYTSDDINDILAIAIARRITISVVVGVLSGSNNPYTIPGFLDLKGLTDKTLGVFLDPYQQLFGLYTNANKIKEILPQLMPALVDKVDVSIGTTNADSCNYQGNFSYNCGLPSSDSCPPNAKGYIALFSATISNKNPLTPVNPNFILNLPAGTTNIVNAYTTQIYSFPLTQVMNATSFSFSGDKSLTSCDFHIWTNIASAKTFIGYIQDVGDDVKSLSSNQADVTSSLPIQSVPNTIVAYTKYIVGAKVGSPTIECIGCDSSIKFTPINSVNARPCIFDSIFAELSCSYGNYGLLHFYPLSPFLPYEEFIPFICSNDLNSITNATNEIVRKNIVIPEPPKIAKDPVCDDLKNNNQLALQQPIYEKQSINRSFSLVLSNSFPVINELFNQPFDQQFIAVLDKYIHSYPDGFFTNYHLQTFVNDIISDIPESTNYSEFRTKLMKQINFDQNLKSNNQTSTSLNDLLCKLLCSSKTNIPKCSEQISGFDYFFLTPDSEIFIISDVALNDDPPPCAKEAIDFYKLRINFLFLNSYNNLYEGLIQNPSYLSLMSKGFSAFVNGESDLLNFFDTYQGKQDSQLVLTDYYYNINSGQTRNSLHFSYTKGNNYFAMLRVDNYIPPLSIISLINTVNNDSTILQPAQIILNKLALFNLPSTLDTGTYVFSFFTKIEHNYYYLKIIEVAPSNRYYFAFSTDYQSNDAYLSFPKFNDKNALNQAISLYPVLSTTNNDSATFSIYQINDKFEQDIIYEGSYEQRSCIYNQYIKNFTFFCTQPNNYYYLKVNNIGDTRTTPVLCYSNTTSNLICFNGVQIGNQCVCNEGYSGDQCQNIICLNGGSAINNNQACNCTSDYNGAFCQISLLQCINPPQYPEFASEVSTLIYIIHADSVVLNQVDTNPLDPSNAFSITIRQFILATYYCDSSLGSMAYQVQSFDAELKFKSAIAKIKSVSNQCSSMKVSDVLKSSLQLATGARSLVIMATTSTQCDDINIDSALVNLIAKNKAEIRLFYNNLAAKDCVTMLTSFANGLAIYTNINQYQYINNYVNTLIPNSDPSQVLNIVDVVYYRNNSCMFGDVPINIDTSKQIVLTITLFNLDVSITGITPIPLLDDSANSVKIATYTIPAGTESVILSFKNTGAKTECGYLIEALTYFPFSYGQTPLFLSATPRYATINAKNNNMTQANYFIADVRNANWTNHPQIQQYLINNITGDHGFFPLNATPPTYRSCASYAWTWQYDVVNTFLGVVKTKVIVNKNGVNNQQVVNNYILPPIQCVHGTNLYWGACLCEYGWTGFDCSYPICLNGGKFVSYASNGGSGCKCNPPYYGQRCENNANQTLPLKRNILILLDTSDSDSGLFSRRIAIIKKTLSLYDDKNAQFAFASNTGNDTVKFIPLGTKAAVLDGLPSAPFPSAPILLDSAFEFFDSFNLNSESSEYISGILFVTQTSYDIHVDQSHYNNLTSRNVILISGIPGTTLPSTDDSYALELNLIGGAVESTNDDDIISQYVNAMKGSDIPVYPVTTTLNPALTTTTVPRACVYFKNVDIELFIDVTILARPYENIILRFGEAFGSGFYLTNTSTRILVRPISDVTDWSNFSQKQTFCNFDNVTFWTNIENFNIYRTQELYLNTSLVEAQADFTNPNNCADASKPQYILYLTAHPTVNDAATAPVLKNSIPSNVTIFALTYEATTNYTSFWNQIVSVPTNLIQINQTNVMDIVNQIYDIICK